jgi:hypothetical protein
MILDLLAALLKKFSHYVTSWRPLSTSPLIIKDGCHTVGDTSHALCDLNNEVDLTAIPICTDSASTRQALNRRPEWNEDKW